MTNSRSGRLVGDLEGDLEKGVGEGGVASMECEDGALGDEDASRRVRVEGFAGVGRGGKPVNGILGTEPSLW